MAYSIKLSLDQRRTKKDGSYPLIMRLSVNTKSTSISLGYGLKENEWDHKKQKVRNGAKSVGNVNRFNNRLQKKKTEALDILLELDSRGEIDRLSLSDIKSRITNQGNSDTFFKFTERLIDEMLQKGNIGNARVYQETLQWVKNYNGETDFALKQISYAFLKRIEAKYLGAGNSVNGLSVRMRTLRSIYNRSVAEGFVSKDEYAFDDYSIKQKPTPKRAISNDDLEKIKHAELTDMQMARARIYFLLSYYLMGASFIDLAYLRISNIDNGKINYRRRKTGQLYKVKITEPLENLLQPFLKSKTDDDLILPIIKTPGDTKKEYDEIRSAICQHNKDLKKLAAHLDIRKDSFSSYVSRHTFATIARDKDIPVPVISKMLGHGDTKTTEIYLDSLKDEVIDEALDKIIGE